MLCRETAARVLDFSIYVDAKEKALGLWYVDRFLALRHTAFRDPYFHRYAGLSDVQVTEIDRPIWQTIDLVDLRENILPPRGRADLILRKACDRQIQEIGLR